MHAEALHALQDDVEAAIGQAFGMGDEPDAAHRVDGRPALVFRLESGLEQRHPDHPVARQGVFRHRAIARLEDVERQEHAREEDDVG